MEKGNILAKCVNCGKLMRVSVTFPAWNEPFEPVLHKCEFCNAKQYITDPHKYNEYGTIENI